MNEGKTVEETITERGVEYVQRWATQNVPDEGTTYQVVRDEWTEDFTVRTIHAWVEVQT